jgi:hypothetical protein
MNCSKQRLKEGWTEGRRGSAMPDVYRPAVWPVELQQLALDWYAAWSKRCLYWCLLRLSDQQLRTRDLSRPRVMAMARLPLRQVVAERRKTRESR